MSERDREPMSSILQWSPILRITGLLGAVLFPMGCAIGPMLKAADYEGEPVPVEIACEDPFRVLENARRRRLKVSSAFLPELGRSFWRCDDPDVVRLQRSERFHKAAREYLRRTGRETCHIEDTTLLALNSYEFRYICPERNSSEDAQARRRAEKKQS